MKPNPQTTEDLAQAVRDSLESLKLRRPIFHSEGDLQLEFGCALREAGFERVRSEKRFEVECSDIVPDIVADGVAFELKEKCKRCSVLWEGEHFDLRGSASFSKAKLEEFHKDIRKLGCLIRHTDEIKLGFALLLTSRDIPSDKELKLTSELPDVDRCNVRLVESDKWGKVDSVVTRYFLVEVRPES